MIEKLAYRTTAKGLAEIAAKKPGGLPALAAISGVGEGKLERYGAAVLEVLRAVDA